MNSVSLPVSTRNASLGASRPSNWRRLVHEPLLHFVLAGAAIFVLAHLVETARRDAESILVVDDGLRQRLTSLYRTQFGVAPTSAQLQTIVDDYVDDEVLYREALRLGLDRDDEIIRRRLIQKLEFLQRDSVAEAELAPASLREYYAAHRAQFTTGARVSFRHLYFNPDRGGDAQALLRAKRTRADLLVDGGLAVGNRVAGDAFPLESDYAALTRDDAIRLFGTSNFVDSLFGSRPSEWSAPVRSGFGWHLIQVTELQAPHLAPFETVLPEVRAAYLQDETARARRERLDALRTHYHLVSRGSGSGGAAP